MDRIEVDKCLQELDELDRKIIIAIREDSPEIVERPIFRPSFDSLESDLNPNYNGPVLRSQKRITKLQKRSPMINKTPDEVVHVNRIPDTKEQPATVPQQLQSNSDSVHSLVKCLKRRTIELFNDVASTNSKTSNPLESLKRKIVDDKLDVTSKRSIRSRISLLVHAETSGKATKEVKTTLSTSEKKVPLSQCMLPNTRSLRSRKIGSILHKPRSSLKCNPVPNNNSNEPCAPLPAPKNIRSNKAADVESQNSVNPPAGSGKSGPPKTKPEQNSRQLEKQVPIDVYHSESPRVLSTSVSGSQLRQILTSKMHSINGLNVRFPNMLFHSFPRPSFQLVPPISHVNQLGRPRSVSPPKPMTVVNAESARILHAGSFVADTLLPNVMDQLEGNLQLSQLNSALPVRFPNSIFSLPIPFGMENTQNAGKDISRPFLTILVEPNSKIRVSDPSDNTIVAPITDASGTIPPVLRLMNWTPKPNQKAFLLVFVGTACADPYRNFFYEIFPANGCKDLILKSLSSGTQAVEINIPNSTDPTIILSNLGVVARNSEAPAELTNDNKIRLIFRGVIQEGDENITLQITSDVIHCEKVEKPPLPPPIPLLVPVVQTPELAPEIKLTCPSSIPSTGNVDIAVLGCNFTSKTRLFLCYVGTDSDIEIEEELHVNYSLSTGGHLVSRIPPNQGSAVLTATLLVRTGSQDSAPYPLSCFPVSKSGEIEKPAPLKNASPSSLTFRLSMPRETTVPKSSSTLSHDSDQSSQRSPSIPLAQAIETNVVYRINNLLPEVTEKHVFDVLKANGAIVPIKVQAFATDTSNCNKIMMVVLRSADKSRFVSIDSVLWNKSCSTVQG